MVEIVSEDGIGTDVPRYKLVCFKKTRRFQHWLVTTTFVIPVIIFFLRILSLVIFKVQRIELWIKTINC